MDSQAQAQAQAQARRGKTFYEYWAGTQWLGCGFHTTYKAALVNARRCGGKLSIRPEFVQVRVAEDSVLATGTTPEEGNRN